MPSGNLAPALRRRWSTGSDHHGVGAAGDGLGDVAALLMPPSAITCTYTPVSSRWRMRAPATSAIAVAWEHRCRAPRATCRRCPVPRHEHTGGAGAHEVQCGLVARAAADDHRQFELAMNFFRLSGSTVFETCSAETTVPWMTRMSRPASRMVLAIQSVRAGVTDARW